MTIQLNGSPHPMPQPETLATLLAALAPATPFAVAKNGDFIPRTTYDSIPLQPGDRIDIVHPTAGG